MKAAGGNVPSLRHPSRFIQSGGMTDGLKDDGTIDADLVRRIRNGDRQAEFDLYRRWQPRLFGLARRYITVDQAEDAAQVALWNAIVHLDTYNDARRFDGWILRIVKNVVNDRRRRKEIRPVDSDEQLGQAADPSPDHSRQTVREVEVTALRACIDCLAEPFRGVVGLHLARFSLAEMGRMLGKPKTTVQGWLKEAKGRLSRCMAGRGFT